MPNVIRPRFGKVKPDLYEVRHFYGETSRYRVGLVACSAEPCGAALKVVMCTIEDGNLEAVAALLDGPQAEAEAERIAIAVLRALQMVDRCDRS